ncbi:hypothetical protein A0J61_10674 [Choanephora cucurbitarum]|uniref:ATP-dependent DNA helicase n=1 Tax=Choanephora cucurbitarum TaxID=101091 RepID=A0A1C7MWS3_9FUNG|nr:hypothetical protein A0J61_10674 [Choanephora cucurbitarum]
MRLASSNHVDQAFSQWIGNLSYNPMLNGKISLLEYIPQYHSLLTAIIAPRNDMVEGINKYLLDQLPGDKTSLFAANCFTQEDSTGAVDRQMPAEYLQSSNPPGLPPSI